MQDNGEIESSQSVKLYKASMVLSGEIPEGNEIDISTNSEVLSSTFLILIFPFSFAFKIELQWWLFALPVLLVFVLVIIAISVKTVQTATLNPVKSLRTE